MNVAILRPNARATIRLGVALTLVAALLVALAPRDARAATLSVSDAAGLEDAVAAAASGDVIELAPGTYAISELLVVTIALTVVGTGSGPAETVITTDGGYDGGIFYLDGGSLIVDNLTLTGAEADYGPAIASDDDGYERLEIRNSVLSGNTSTSGYGGAVYLFAETDVAEDFRPVIVITNSVFSDNTEVDNGQGGAIYAGGFVSLTITGSTFERNTAQGSGGAVYVECYLCGSEEDITITGSTFRGNSADDGGGALYAYGWGQLSIAGTTFSGNTTGEVYGGSAILLEPWTGDSVYPASTNAVGIENSTLTDNVAAEGSDGGAITVYDGSGLGDAELLNVTIAGNDGGGIVTDEASLLTTNSIVADNGGADCDAELTSGGGNLDSDGTCGLTESSDQQSVTTAALGLGALASNGGPTQTLAITADSAAYQAGVSAACPATDQRGVTRKDPCDSGAFEFVVVEPDEPDDPDDGGTDDGSGDDSTDDGSTDDGADDGADVSDAEDELIEAPAATPVEAQPTYTG